MLNWGHLTVPAKSVIAIDSDSRRVAMPLANPLVVEASRHTAALGLFHPAGSSAVRVVSR